MAEVSNEKSLLQQEQDVLNENNEDAQLHPLQNEWTLWYHSPVGKGATIDYSKALQEVHTISTVCFF